MNKVAILSTPDVRKSVLELVVSQVEELAGYEIWLADNFEISHSLKENLRDMVSRCDLAIAILSDVTANIAYEIGLFSGAGKPVIILKADNLFLPASLREHQSINLNFDNMVTWKSSDSVSIFKKSFEKLTLNYRPKSRIERSSKFSDEKGSSFLINFRNILDKERDFGHNHQTNGMQFEKRVADLLKSIRGWHIESSANRQEDCGFDFIAWNEEDESISRIVQNPIAVQVKYSKHLYSSYIESSLKSAERKKLKTLILFSSSLVRPDVERKWQVQSRKLGVTLIIFDKQDLLDFSGSDGFIEILAKKIIRYPSDVL